MRHSSHLLLVLVFVGSAIAHASAQTPYQDAMRIMLIGEQVKAFDSADDRDITALIIRKDLLKDFEAAFEQAYMKIHFNIDPIGSLNEPPGGEEDPAEPVPAQRTLTDMQRKAILGRMRVELSWIERFNAYTTANTVDFQALVTDRPSELTLLNEIAMAFSGFQQAGFGTGAGVASVLGFDQAKLITAITDWAIDRAQEELLNAFVKRWLEDLKKQPYLQLALPSTTNMINTSDLVGMLAQGDAWKASFERDLRSMPERADTLVMKALTDLTSGSPAALADKALADELGTAAKMFGVVYRGLNEEKDLHAIIATEALRLLAITTPVTPFKKDPGYTHGQRAIMGAAALLGAVRVKKEEGKWGYLDPMDLLELTDAQVMAWWKMVCVTYAKHLEKSLGLSADELAQLAVLDPIDDRVFDARRNLLQMAEGIQAMGKLGAPTLGAIASGTDKTKLDAAAGAKYLDLVLGLLEHGVELTTAIKHDSAFVRNYQDHVAPVVEQVRTISEGAITADYGKVVSSTLDLMELFRHAGGDSSKELADFSNAINKYGGFMVDVLTADSSAEIEAALKKVTMGTGAYRVKESSSFSAMVSLYPGGIYGEETARLLDPDEAGVTDVTEAVAAFYLPVGVSLSWGTNCKVFPSVGIFLQALDLGSVMSYRLAPSDSIASEPSYSFDMLLSPGGGLTVQIGRSPVTLGWVWSVTPSLREVTQDGLSYQANVWRQGLFIGVDVSAFQLFASKRKRTLGSASDRVIRP